MRTNEFRELFSEEFFVPEIDAEDKKDLLGKLVDHLSQTDRVRNPRLILESLLRREELGSTGIGRGVAIPHCRTLNADDLLVVFARLKSDLDYDSLDGQPVRLVFLILAPPQERTNRYLPALGRIVEMIKDDETRGRLLELSEFSEFIEVIESARAR